MLNYSIFSRRKFSKKTWDVEKHNIFQQYIYSYLAMSMKRKVDGMLRTFPKQRKAVTGHGVRESLHFAAQKVIFGKEQKLLNRLNSHWPQVALFWEYACVFISIKSKISSIKKSKYCFKICQLWYVTLFLYKCLDKLEIPRIKKGFRSIVC